CLLGVLLLASQLLYAQEVAPQKPNKVAPTDTIVPGKGTPKEQIKEIEKVKVKELSDSAGGNEPKKSALVDTTIQNKYGDLLDDDSTNNRKYPLWIPLLQVAGADAFVWSMDRYAMNADFSRIGPESWKYNLKKGWEWDVDRFG